MALDALIEKQLQAWFAPLNTVGAAKAFPPPTTLSKGLGKIVPRDIPAQRNINIKLTSQFMTAGVEIWLRAVHSFLVSAALTNSSPIWASVTGYYSSHYSVRGLAHLMGYFQLFTLHRIARLDSSSAGYICEFIKKDGGDREHKLYWKLVKKSDLFKGNPLFTENSQESKDSDVAHRNHANYADHLAIYPTFEPLSAEAIKDRIDHITKIVFDAPPLPRLDKFPDVEFVQLIAYHRIVAFRSLLDEALGGKNKFWNVHRDPPFARGFMTFQLAQGHGLAQLGA